MAFCQSCTVSSRSCFIHQDESCRIGVSVILEEQETADNVRRDAVIERPKWQLVKCEISGSGLYDRQRPPCHTPVVTRLLSTSHAKGSVLTAYSKVMCLYLNRGVYPPNCTECFLTSHSCSLCVANIKDAGAAMPRLDDYWEEGSSTPSAAPQPIRILDM
jgi:hypothetical protein